MVEDSSSSAIWNNLLEFQLVASAQLKDVAPLLKSVFQVQTAENSRVAEKALEF